MIAPSFSDFIRIGVFRSEFVVSSSDVPFRILTAVPTVISHPYSGATSAMDRQTILASSLSVALQEVYHTLVALYKMFQACLKHIVETADVSQIFLNNDCSDTWDHVGATLGCGVTLGSL